MLKKILITFGLSVITLIGLTLLWCWFRYWIIYLAELENPYLQRTIIILILSSAVTIIVTLDDDDAPDSYSY
jgi:hypothetical protein